jgi:RNA polymerase sigma-70 factor, ECF subfamily
MLVVAELEQLPVAQAKSGDAEAWSTLFRRYQLPLYVYVFELLQDEQASLDVVQETFIAAVQHIGSLREEGKFGGWLFGIAHQKCVQSWRRKSRRDVLWEEFADPAAELGEGPDELLIRQEQEGEFMKLVNALPLPQRSVLLLHFVEDFSLEQIAEITETPIGTVKSRLHYGKRALRKMLEESK